MQLVPIQIDKCRLTPTGATFDDGLTMPEWLAIGKKLKIVETCHQFLLGDWLNFGKASYGEKYSLALEMTDYDYQSLRDCVWVCGSVELSRRKDSLSFSHHKEVAGEKPNDQELWLARAESNKWSVMDLREAIRDSKAKKQPKDQGNKANAFAAIITQAQRWISELEQSNPIDTWLPIERQNTKAQLKPLVDFYERL